LCKKKRKEEAKPNSFLLSSFLSLNFCCRNSLYFLFLTIAFSSPS
jgi:hypothetical protein